jgi:hypothetical protein
MPIKLRGIIRLPIPDAWKEIALEILTPSRAAVPEKWQSLQAGKGLC